MKEFKGTVINWQKVDIGIGKSVVVGVIVGHPVFEDGLYFRSSEVVRIDGNRLETLNSIYELGAPYDG